MKKAAIHYKFINSKTGYAIYYHALDPSLDARKVKEELEKMKIRVAIQNGIYVDTIYYEKIKD